MAKLPKGLTFNDQIPVRIDRSLARDNLPELIAQEVDDLVNYYGHVVLVKVITFDGKEIGSVRMILHRCCGHSTSTEEFRIEETGGRISLVKKRR